MPGATDVAEHFVTHMVLLMGSSEFTLIPGGEANGVTGFEEQQKHWSASQDTSQDASLEDFPAGPQELALGMLHSWRRRSAAVQREPTDPGNDGRGCPSQARPSFAKVMLVW